MQAAAIPHGLLLLFAIITFAIGLASHYGSDWNGWEVNGKEAKPAPYEVCDLWKTKGSTVTIPANRLFPRSPQITVSKDVDCPKISLERYFVAMVIICLMWSLVSICLAMVASNGSVALTDVILNIIFGILLLIAAGLYIRSSKNIHELLKEFNINWEALIGKDFKEKRAAKVAAGVFGILQSFLHFIVAGVGTSKVKS